MSRKENYDIGWKAEERIKALLSESGKVTPNTEYNGCPDFYFQRHHYTTTWAVEFKTMRGVHAGGEVGNVKVSTSQLLEMKRFEESKSSYLRMLIVEVRPRGAKPKDFLYYVVPWSEVYEKWYISKPDVLTLSLWWVLREGTKLSSVLTG